MHLFKANGTRVTKATVSTSAVPAADVPKVLAEDLYEMRSYGPTDPKPEGSLKFLRFTAGTVLTQRQIDNLFDTAKITKITPANGLAAGGATVTIEGEHLDGVTAVNFGGTPGTSLSIKGPRKLTVVTPAKAAGAYAVDVVDDGGTVSKANGFTYA